MALQNWRRGSWRVLHHNLGQAWISNSAARHKHVMTSQDGGSGMNVLNDMPRQTVDLEAIRLIYTSEVFINTRTRSEMTRSTNTYASDSTEKN